MPNNILQGQQFYVAKENANFADIPALNSTNVIFIYWLQPSPNVFKVFIPGSGFNTLTAFQSGQSYQIAAKVDFELLQIGLPMPELTTEQLAKINLLPGAVQEYDTEAEVTTLLIAKGLVEGQTMGITLVGGEIVLSEVTGGGPVEPETVVFTTDNIPAAFSTPTGGGFAADGSNTVPGIGAPVYIFTGGNQGFGGIMRHNETTLAGETYKMEAYLKKTNYDYVGMRIEGGTIGSTYPFINLSNGTVNDLDLDNVSCQVETLTDGWYLFSVTVTNATANTSVDIALTNSTGNHDYNPGGTNTVKIARTTIYTT